MLTIQSYTTPISEPLLRYNTNTFTLNFHLIPRTYVIDRERSVSG